MLRLNDRKSKIRFLNGLLEGKQSIRELNGKDNLKILVGFNNDTKFYINDKEITEEKFSEYIRSIKFGEIKTSVSII